MAEKTKNCLGDNDGSAKVSSNCNAKKYLDYHDYCKKMADKLTKNDIIPNELYTAFDVKRGLRNANGTGVLVGLTTVSNVDGYDIIGNNQKIAKKGKLFYRGYDIEDIVENCISEKRFGFEEVTYLLLFGQLPNSSELQEFNDMLASRRILPEGFAQDTIMTMPSSNMMNKLARSVLTLYSYDDNPDDTSVENVLRQSVELIGCFPSLIAHGYKAKLNMCNENLKINLPVKELSTAENMLHMIRPEGNYTNIEARLLDLCLVLHAEHGGGNNSTFTTHLVSSSGTDTYGVIAAAISSLKGPRHGGASHKVVKMVADIAANVDISKKNEVDDFLRKILCKKVGDRTGLVYGLGHAIYTASDPRAILLKKLSRELAESKGLEKEFELYEYIEERTPSLYKELFKEEALMPANVDLYSGFVYKALDIPMDLVIPLFATARLSGWCAHRIEEIITGNKLMRPAYLGISPKSKYIPLKRR